MYGGLAFYRRLERGRGGMARRIALALAGIVLVVAGSLSTPVSPALAHGTDSARADVTGSITVAAVPDYGYQPDTFEQVPTDASITVTFTDDDVLEHTFTISSREGFVIPTSYTPAELDQLFVTYPPLYSALVTGQGNQSVGTFLSPASPGWYEFVCNVSGHFQNGMYGFIAFGEDLPSNLTRVSRTALGGANITPLDDAAIGVVLFVAVLGLVVWRRRRARPRPLPEPARRPRTESGR